MPSPSANPPEPFARDILRVVDLGMVAPSSPHPRERAGEYQVALGVLLGILQARRSHIHEHWQQLLESAAPTNPLGGAAILVFEFDQTLSALFCEDVHSGRRRHLPVPMPRHPANPWAHYFVTLEQTLLHVIHTTQIEWPKLSSAARVAALDEILQRVRRMARREIRLLDKILLGKSLSPMVILLPATAGNAPGAVRHLQCGSSSL